MLYTPRHPVSGNPGLDTYYCYFMTCIVDKLTDDAAAAEGSDVKIPDIVCMSYAGHVNPGHNEVRAGYGVS